MRRSLLVACSIAIACDSAADVELPHDSYVLSRVDNKVVPAEVFRDIAGPSTQTGRILYGSLTFEDRDSATFTLHTDVRYESQSGQPAEEMCTSRKVAYRLDGNRVYLDLVIPPQVFPPSTGLGSYPGVTLHDTLYVNGSRLTGAHVIKFAPDELQNKRVQLEFMYAPVPPSPCNLPGM